MAKSWCLSLLVPTLRCVVGNAATDLGDTCGTACEDHMNLLQHRKSIVDKRLDTTTTAAEPPYQGKAAMAFAGGGFLSLADFFAAVVGFLNVKASTSGGRLTELFQKFDIIAGTSGGAWLYNYLVYSKSFQDIVQNAAAFPEYAGTLYNTDFQVRWLAYWRPQPTGHSIFNCLTLKKDVKGMNITDLIDELWENVTEMKGKVVGDSLVQRQGKPHTEWTETLNGLDDALHALPKELHKSEVEGWRNVRRSGSPKGGALPDCGHSPGSSQGCPGSSQGSLAGGAFHNRCPYRVLDGHLAPMNPEMVPRRGVDPLSGLLC